jgi:hypothetical protein
VMPTLRPSTLTAALMPFAALVYAVGCDVNAIAVDDCRAIETARCVAARQCDLGIDSDDDEAVCRRFARDNCLHGLSTGVVPKRGLVESCLRVIEGAGECAKDNGDTNASECESIGATQDRVTVCEVIEDPTQAYACAFLLEDPPEEPEPEPEDAGSD